MPRGRPRLYKTEEELRAAKNRKSQRFHDNNRDTINERRRNVYHKLRHPDTPNEVSNAAAVLASNVQTGQSPKLSWRERAQQIPTSLMRYTRTSTNSVYFTRLYFEYLRLEGEADKETAVKLLVDNEESISNLLDKANQCFKHIYEEEGYGKGAKEAEGFVQLVKDVHSGVSALWESAIVSESAAEFKQLVRETRLQLDV